MSSEENRFSFSTTVRRRRRNVSCLETIQRSSSRHLSTDNSSSLFRKISCTERTGTYEFQCYESQVENRLMKMDNNGSDSRDVCTTKRHPRVRASSSYKRFFASSSLLKVFLLMYVFALVMKSCESSAKWW